MNRNSRCLPLAIITISLLVAMACATSKRNTMPAAAFDLQGHRGCRGLLPENTIPAMLKALQLGVTTLEMDVVITADKEVLLSHEPFFNHEISTHPSGTQVTEAEEKSLNIYKMTLAQAQQFDVGMAPHPRFAAQQKMAVSKPTLQQVIQAVKAYCQQNNHPLPAFNIETKCMPATDNQYHPTPEVFVILLMQVIMQQQVQQQTIIQSFDFRTLQYLHQQYPSIKTAALIEDDDQEPFAQQLKKLGFIPTIYSPAHTLVTPLLVKQCKDMGIKLIPWTVNDPARGQALKAMGVDGLITDYPDRVR